jgi:hypothetical protein
MLKFHKIFEDEESSEDEDASDIDEMKPWLSLCARWANS